MASRIAILALLINEPESDADIEGAIESMVELALAHHIKVVLACIPPAIDFGWHPGLDPAPRIQQLNAWIKSYAGRGGIYLAPCP